MRRVLMLLPLAGLAAGCVIESTHPLYTAKDLVFDAALIGDWVDVEAGDGAWTVRREKGGYALTYTEGDASTRYRARLVRLGAHRFIDVVPVPAAGGPASGAARHLIGRVIRLDRDTVCVGWMDGDRFEEMSEAGPSVAFESEDGGIVLTEPTAGLQRFVVAHAMDEALFPSRPPPADGWLGSSAASCYRRARR